MTLSVFFEKTFASQKSRVSQAGQAVVEYILVLVVTVSIIIGILYQFNDAFKGFLDNYFGDYIACLLETGELPSLGGDGPTQSECNAGFANFSIANGRPSKGSNGSSSGRGSGGDSSGSSGKSADDASDSQSTGQGSRRRSRPSKFTSNHSPSNSEASASSRKGRPARQSVRNNQAIKDASGLGAGSSDASAGGGRGRRIVRKRIIHLGEEYLTKDAKKKKDKVVSRGKPKKKNGKSSSLRKATFELELPKPKRKLAEADLDGFSFGFFIKFLLIAAIIIALLLFLGGQALQIKKSWQKSE